MAKTKQRSHSRQQSGSKDILHSTNNPLVKSSKREKPRKTVEELLTEATSLLEQSQPEFALPIAEEAVRRLDSEPQSRNIELLAGKNADGIPTLPLALTVIAEIYLGLGDSDLARNAFMQAIKIDPDGVIVSAEPYLWLAQLGEEGGQQSLAYFEKAVEVLRDEIEVLEEVTGQDAEQTRDVLDLKKKSLADALCGIAELYMTDLSWEGDAESRCENLITEAVAICPDHLSAGVLQTLASIRVSQERMEEAQRALQRSMELWTELPEDVEDIARPDFATRVSLARLLMEVGAETDAMSVVERLVKEDDESVECWYLGGWCQVLISEKSSHDQKLKHQEQARQWLETCLKIYRKVDYEDDRLRDHAKELFSKLNNTLGLVDDIPEAEDDAEWEDEDEDGEVEDEEDVELELNGHDRTIDGDVEMT